MPVPTKAWADGPFELISPTKSGAKKESTLTGASKMASEMTVIHNLLLRGINSIYNQCLGVSEKGTDKDKLDFVNYAYQWVDMLEEHHQAEEEQFFPQMGELAGVPGLMDSSVEQHQLFHHGLEKFQTYLNEVKAGSAVFDGQTLKDIVDEFMPILRAHLDDEIDALVALEKYDDKCDWAAWFSGKAEKLGQQYFKDARYRTDVFPLMFHLHDSSYGDGAWADFPPLPWLLQFIVRWMFMGKHADWWRFAPCDYRSARRGLPFAQEGTLDNN